MISPCCPDSPRVAVVINDDPTQLATLRQLLKKAGLAPQGFANAEEALAALDPKAVPALIVTDLYMPGIDGWRVCRLLRSREYADFNHVPLLVVSATFAGEEPDRIAADLGADAFMHAPVDARPFLDLVGAVLGGEQKRLPLRVLIAGETGGSREALQEALAESGYAADFTSSVAEGAAAGERTAYHGAAIAETLVDGEGAALLDRFRAIRPDCVCVMMTSGPGPKVILDWMKRGAAAHVYLPFHPANLVEMITRARRERALLRAEDLLEIRTRDLRQSEERFRVLVDTMLDPLLILGFDGSLRFANPAAFSLLELPPQETFAGLSIHRFLTAEGQAQAKVDLLTIQRTGGPVMREYELRTGSGGGRLVEANGVRSIYGGEAVDVVCLRDVTERKRSEERTRSSESKFRELYSLLRLLSDTMPDMLWAKDLKKQYLFANKAVCAELLCATDTNEPLRKTDMFFADRERAAHPDDRDWHTFGELCQDSDAATLTAMREMEFHEFGNVRGRLLHLEVRKAPFYNHAGELIGVVGSARNITERVANEAKLKDVQQTHAEIFNTLTDAIYVHDRSGTIIAANKGAEVMYGLSREELIGLKPQDLAAPGKNDMVAVMSRTLAVFETGKSIQLEFWGRRKNGEDFPKEVIVNRGRYFGEEVLIVTARDASEKKKAEAERDKLQAQLIQAQKMEAIGRLAGGVAHDFNNMLQAIVGNAELAQVGITPDSPLFEPLQEVSKCAKRSADLTRQLLAFARKQAVSPKVIDLSVTVEGMLKMLRRLIGESVDLAWLPDRQEALVKIDPSQVDQILANLCVNARDAIRGVGQIRLATDILTLDEVQAEVHPDAVAGDYVRLMVSDTGCGMPPETMVRLFEPFFTTKEPGKGTGLGLATVYGIVRQNRGFITVRSAPGQGSTFAIHLPRHNAKPTGIEKRESAEPFHRGQGTILVVEDEPAILRLAKRALLGLGYTVLTATSPREALEIAAQYNGNIDLLLTDVIMPEMTGRELGEQLLASRPSLKRLYMSGYTADVIADHGALEAGVNFLQKPFSIAALGTKVRDTIVGN